MEKSLQHFGGAHRITGGECASLLFLVETATDFDARTQGDFYRGPYHEAVVCSMILILVRVWTIPRSSGMEYDSIF
jgi:hypothetical protein